MGTRGNYTKTGRHSKTEGDRPRSRSGGRKAPSRSVKNGAQMMSAIKQGKGSKK